MNRPFKILHFLWLSYLFSYSSHNRFCYGFAVTIELKTQKLTTIIKIDERNNNNNKNHSSERRLKFDQTHAKWYAVSKSHNGIVCMPAYTLHIDKQMTICHKDIHNILKFKSHSSKFKLNQPIRSVFARWTENYFCHSTLFTFGGVECSFIKVYILMPKSWRTTQSIRLHNGKWLLVQLKFTVLSFNYLIVK